MSGSTGRIALGVVGAVVGAYFGQPALGYAIGAGIGAIAFPDQLPDIVQEGPKLGDLRVMSSAYGRAMPIAFGVVRVAGNLIWSSGIDQHTITRTEDAPSGGGGGKGGPQQEVTTTTYTYSANFAISLCEGTIFGIRRIWANGEIVVDLGSAASYATYVKSGTFASVSLASLAGPGTEQSGPSSMRVYAGDETQVQDPLILAIEGDAPAYRGVAYVVFENLQLARFNNGIPNLEFEVITVGTSSESLQQLDAVSRFGLAANGTITPDGLLLVAYQTSVTPYVSYLALVNPFDLSPIRDYNVNAFLGGVHVSPYISPRMNGQGDILFADENGSLYFWPAGGTPVSVSFDPSTRSSVDGNGNFYVAGRMADSHYKVLQIKPNSGQIVVFRDLGLTVAGTIIDLFNPRDGTLVYAYNGTTGIIEKLDGLSNAVLGTWVTNARPHSVCVAGDGSIWYLSGASSTVKIWRVNAAMSAEVLILDTGGTATGAAQTRLGRDWSNGDILWADGSSGGTMRRYDESGTLVSALGSVTGMNEVATDAAFPERIYTFNKLGITGTQFVHAYRALSISESTVTVADAIGALCARVGLLSGDLDVTALTMQLRGYVIANRGPARNALYQLMTAFMFDAVESEAKIKFVLRGAAPAATISEDDLGAKLGAIDQGGEAYSISRQQEPELPHELAINYLDATAAYQVGTQYGRRLIGHSDNDQSINLAVVMTADEAVQLAQALLYEAWAARQQYKVAVSSKWARLEPTDAVTVLLDDGSQYTARVLRATEGQGVRELELSGYEASIYTQDAGGAALPEPPVAVSGLSQTLLEVLDTALLRDIDDTYGLLMAACGYTDNWPGCKIFKSLDGVAYVDAAISVPLPVAMGYTLTVLGAYSGGMFDETNTVEVSVLSGVLSSTTEAAVLNGANACYLGGEILQFKNAVLIAIGTYRLSGLLRGRLGTEWATGRHIVGQVFVRLDGALLRSLVTPVSDQGVTRWYKGVTFGTPVAQAAARSIVQASNRIKPVSPAYVGGGRDASGNITINWMRRARRSTAWVDLIAPPLDEPTEAYEVDLFAGSGTAITGITSALNGVIASAAHGLIVGDVVYVSGVVGMTPLNTRAFIVDTVPDAGHFTVGEPTAGYTAYASGGVVRKKARTVTGISTETTSYSAANQTTDYGGTQATIFAVVYQISSRVGRGYAGIGTI